MPARPRTEPITALHSTLGSVELKGWKTTPGGKVVFLTARGGVHLLEGEDGLYVTLASHCGLSFRFAIPSRETPGKAWSVAHVVQRHGSAVADRILVTRCSA